MWEVGNAAVGEWSEGGSAGGDAGERELLLLTDVTVAGLGLPAGLGGCLAVTTERVRWWRAGGGDAPDAGLSLPLADVVLHAIARDPSAGPPPRIYLQLGDGDAELDLFPACPDADLERIFQAICCGIEMHPPEDGSDSDPSDMYGMHAGLNAPDPVLGRLDAMLQVPEHLANGNTPYPDADPNGPLSEDLNGLRFEDAEESGASPE